jgi:4-hydroxythreonine-4-phosphate dehydrogenase
MLPARETTILAVTLGDAAGIGPEVALKAANQAGWPDRLRLVLVGSREVLKREARQHRLPLPAAWNPRDELPAGARIAAWEPGPEDAAPGEPYEVIRLADTPGRTSAACGRAAAQWIRAAVAGCRAGWFDGLVTAPICKKSLQLAGLPHPAHTEYLAALTGAPKAAMMFVGGPLRVLLATRHLPLREVPAAVTPGAVEEAIRFACRAGDWLGLDPVRVGVCGLNPHAGEDGMLGDEESLVIAPVIERLRTEGLSVSGPIPGDMAFYQALEGRFDLVVAMYHDQGLAPFKMLAFDSGVNLTLGLPIVRTSPDHGTAFDLAGRGVAEPSSMAAAIRLAHELAERPNPWGAPPP